MFGIGDCVIFSLDGARGIILIVNEELCCVFWEDFFVSWERSHLLFKDEQLTQAQQINC
jgi:hypothetical protein